MESQEQGVAVLLGGVAYQQIRSELLSSRYQQLMEDVVSTTRLLSSSLEQAVALEDVAGVDRVIGVVRRTVPDLHYVRIEGAGGAAQEFFYEGGEELDGRPGMKESARCEGCHTSPSMVDMGASLGVTWPSEDSSGEGRALFGHADSRVFEATVPLSGVAGEQIQVGVWDKTVNREIAAVTAGLLRSLALCLVVGLGLAFGLTYLLARPILSLVEATEHIRDGDFSSRARVYSDDEIGRLARMFNSMGETLQAYKETVVEKDQSRLSLIEKIVRAQEEERKYVAR
jgi:HAMP domain-containing protein